MNALLAILLMSVVTYLIRSLPMALIKTHIRNTFIQSFLYYIPYGILTAMTIPYIFYATSHLFSAIVGSLVALVLAWFERSLITVSIVAVIFAFLAECFM